MVNQIFSSKEFQYIFNKENRKGVYLETLCFPDVKSLSDNIKLNGIRKKMYLQLPKNDMGRDLLIKYLNNERKNLINSKDELLQRHFSSISRRISQKKLDMRLQKFTIKADKIFSVYKFQEKNDPVIFFLNQKINQNLKEAFSLKPSNRNIIIPQVQALLANSFPKVIVKVDIESFYESINRKIITSKIKNERNLSSLTKHYILEILKEFGKASSTSISQKGIPRGVSISAYLAELYMKEFDDYFKYHPECSYYARYVDDIIFIFHPKMIEKDTNYLEIITEKLSSIDLKLNSDM